jgi:hypothetical protein
MTRVSPDRLLRLPFDHYERYSITAVGVRGRLGGAARAAAQQHPGRGAQQVVAADHVGDAHVHVVHGVRQVEGRPAC